MKTRYKITSLFALSAIVATEAMADPIRWDLANEYGQSSIMGMSDEVFVQEVEAASDGQIDITVHYDGSIGYRSTDQFDAVGSGAIDIADTVMGAVSGIEPIFLLSCVFIRSWTCSASRLTITCNSKINRYHLILSSLLFTCKYIFQ